jgi:hypothetical protein
MRNLISNWPKLAFTYLPALIFVFGSGSLLSEQLQPPSHKAIQLVKESSSRKENFNVQQYLYSSVYHREKKGEPIVIEGWEASSQAGGYKVSVRFAYTDMEGRHIAAWEVDVERATVTPINPEAIELSWR